MPDNQQFSLYNGEVVLTFAEKSHRYKVSDNGSKPEHCPSVTTILNVLNKPAIKPWAIKITCDYIEENIRQLVGQNTFSVQDIFKIIERARTWAETKREEAADIGTSTHDYLRDWWRASMQKTDSPVLPDEKQVRKCVGGALDFFHDHKMVPVYVEDPVYSRIHKICGRPDWIGYIDDEFSIMDYKSTKKLWPELPIQMAPYAKMYEEMLGKLPSVRWGLRLDKETGDFEPKRYKPEELGIDWHTFGCIFTIYDRFKHLRRVEKPKKQEEDWLAEV
jgi:hypothetical protein